MRILIDTNVLISAAVFPNGVAAKAYSNAVDLRNQPILCDYCIDEFRRIIRNKFPKHQASADSFLTAALLACQIVKVPNEIVDAESKIKDVADRPIVRAAISAKVEIILTGDGDFLNSGITNSMMLSPSEFIQKYLN